MANLPLPLIFYLNVRVTLRFIKVRRLSRHVPVEKPRRLFVGWLMTNIATVFVLVPPLVERRFFVQDYRWLLSYAIAASLTIGGLLLMNSALGEELRQLAASGKASGPLKPVDTATSDTL